MHTWEKLSSLPRGEIRRLQDKKLKHFISTRIYPFHSHYRKLFNRHKIKPEHIKSIDDLKILPFTSKEDLLPTQNNPERFLNFILRPSEELIKEYWPLPELLKMSLLKMLLGSKEIKKRLNKEYRPIFLTATTGTTNQPVSFLYSDYDMLNLRASGYRIIDVAGGREDDRMINVFPYAPHLAFWQSFYSGLSSITFMLSTGGGKVMGTQGDINAIVKLKPNVLIGVPSYVYHLVRSAQEEGQHISSIQKVILGASKVPRGFKEKISSLLHDAGARNICIMGTYGFTEAKCAWVECPTSLEVSSGYHTYPDKEILEVIDPKTGEVQEEGADGELAYTSIDSRGSCVLRYRTGDLVKGGIRYEPCPYCKKTVPRISSDISRASNIKSLNLSKIKGTLVNLNDFADILEGAKEIDEWLIEIRKKNQDPFEVDEIAIYASLTTRYDTEAFKGKLIDQIQVQTEVRPNEIIILSRKEMLELVQMETSRKVRRFIDKRPKS